MMTALRTPELVILIAIALLFAFVVSVRRLSRMTNHRARPNTSTVRATWLSDHLWNCGCCGYTNSWMRVYCWGCSRHRTNEYEETVTNA